MTIVCCLRYAALHAKMLADVKVGNEAFKLN